MIERRAAGAELRAAPGRRIIGAAMRYGAEAQVMLPDGRAVVERFARFAFHDYLSSGAATRLNLQHDASVVIATTAGGAGRGLLTLRDNPDALTIEARLPSGAAFDEALALVADGSTAQTSIEFRALREHNAGGRRTVTQATLPGIGIVDAGAYGGAGAVEVRREGRGLFGRVLYDRPRVTADRGKRRKQSISVGAFKYGLDDLEREIVAQLGDDAGQILGSRRAGSLILNDTAEGLEFEIPELPRTSYADDFAALLDAGTILPGVVPFFTRPPADVVPGAVTFEVDPDNQDVQIEVIHNALLTALSVRFRAPRGNPGEVERRNVRDRERVRAERASRRGRFWL